MVELIVVVFSSASVVQRDEAAGTEGFGRVEAEKAKQK